VADFYAARSNIISPLQWTSLSPPLTNMGYKQNSDTNLNSIAVSNLKTVSRETLIKLWQKTYHTEPPKGISRRMLEHAAAYYIQSNNLGGLSQKIKLKLKRHSSSAPTKLPPNDISNGTLFVREWNGTVHHVEAVDGKFMWKENLYGSLSEVARLITGTRWSGPRFFGLRTSK